MAPRTPTNEDMVASLKTATLQIALDVTTKIQSAQKSGTGAYPIELLKILPTVIAVADDLNGISLASAIDRVASQGYTISTAE